MASPVKTTGSRATRKRERTRAAILDAARELCAAQGAEALTVAALAEAADLGVGTFYYHFRTKDDVLLALMEELLGRVQRKILQQREQFTDPEARLRAGYATFFSMSGEDRELLRVYFRSAAARASFTDAAREFFRQDTIDTILDGQAAGVFRAGDPELLTNWLIGATTETVQWLLEQDAPLDQQAAETVADLMLHGLARRQGHAGHQAA